MVLFVVFVCVSIVCIMFDNVEIKELENSEIEITAEVLAETFESYRSKAVKKLTDSVEIPGFRRGHVPEEVLIQRIGEGAILQEMAEKAIAVAYPKLLQEKKIEAIGRPQITITKIAKGNPLGFKVKTAVMPLVELPDYKAIAQRIMSVPEAEVFVDALEVDDTITKIRENWKRHKEMKEKKEGDVKVSEQQAPGSSEEGLPELNDDFVKQIGDFKDVDAFKVKIRENLREEKKAKEREKKRIQMIDEVIEQSKITLPQVLVDSEREKMMVQFKDNVAMMGVKPEDYFKQINKTEDVLQKEWQGEAEKRVKIQLALNKIVELEHVKVPEDELNKEVTRLLEHYPGVPPERARAYTENLLLNEKVFQFLEGQGSEKT